LKAKDGFLKESEMMSKDSSVLFSAIEKRQMMSEEDIYKEEA